MLPKSDRWQVPTVLCHVLYQNIMKIFMIFNIPIYFWFARHGGG